MITEMYRLIVIDKTTCYHRLPDMSTAVSAILQSEVSSSSSDDWSCISLSGTSICCHSLLSTESLELLRGLDSGSQSKMLIDDGESRYSGSQNIEQMKDTTIKENVEKNGVGRTSKLEMPKNSTFKGYCTCQNVDGTGFISQRPRLQASRKSVNDKHCLCNHMESKDNMKTLNYFTDEEDCPCVQIRGYGNFIMDEMPRQKPQIRTSLKSETAIYSTDGKKILCEEIEGKHILLDKMQRQESQHWPSPKSKIPIDSTDGDHCLCEEIKGTDIIIDKKQSQKPQPQTILKSNMPKDYTNGDPCLCENIESKNERSTRQPLHQTNQMSKKYQGNNALEKSAIITDEPRNRHQSFKIRRKSNQLENNNRKEDDVIQQQTKAFAIQENCERQQQTKNLSLNDCKCQPKSKDAAIKVQSCECKQNSKYSSIKNCECQQQSKDVAVKKNNETQRQSNVFTSNGSCACEKIEARNRLCISNQAGQQNRASTKNSKITKLIKSVRNSISHKMYRPAKVDKNSIHTSTADKVQSQQMQVLSQQIPVDAPCMPDVIYDGYPYEYNCGWLDIEEHMRLKSKLTETTSGFKTCLKRKRRTEETIFEKQEPIIELDFEDAVKYYVGRNLERFRDLIPSFETIKKEKGNRASDEYKRMEDFYEPKDYCGCLYNDARPIPYLLTPVASKDIAKLYPKGLKFCLGGTARQKALVGPSTADTPTRTGAAA